MNVQSRIEMPEIYIVARCQGDEHQLMYSSCRNDDINALIQNPITINGKILNGNVRFFDGDGPACKMEAGQQKNGKYPCWICPANFDRASNLSYVLGLPHQDLQDRMQHVMKTKLYSNLRKHEIIDDNKKNILEEKLCMVCKGSLH